MDEVPRATLSFERCNNIHTMVWAKLLSRHGTVRLFYSIQSESDRGEASLIMDRQQKDKKKRATYPDECLGLNDVPWYSASAVEMEVVSELPFVGYFGLSLQLIKSTRTS